MGQQHNELTNGLFSAALTAALGMAKGRGGLERFGETLQPTINLWERPEWAFLRGEKLWAVRHQLGATAGEFGIFAIANPKDSGLITVIKGLEVRAATGLTASISIFYKGTWTNSVARATMTQQAGLVRALDGRAGGAGILATELWAGSDAATQAGAQNFDLIGMTVVNLWTAALAVPIVLGPDSACAVNVATVNVAYDLRAVGYERKVLSGELV